MTRATAWIMAALALFGLASFATTAIAWLVTGDVAVLGLVYAAVFWAMAFATPYLDRAEKDGPPCRSCGQVVSDLSFGFCLRCGIEEPLARRRALH